MQSDYLLGVYYISDIVIFDNCSQKYKDYDPLFRNEIEYDNLGCSNFYFIFLEDGVYNRILKDYYDDSNGNFIETYSQTNEGTYSISGIEITMLTGFSKSIVFKYKKDKITSYRSFWQDCIATRSCAKRQEKDFNCFISTYILIKKGPLEKASFIQIMLEINPLSIKRFSYVA